MNTLIIFATYSGGTEAAVNVLSETLKAKGQTVTLISPTQTNPEEMTKYDLVILASPSWDTNGKEGQPHEDYFSLIEKSKGKTCDGRKFAIMGLGDSSYPHFCGAVDELEKFVNEIKGALTVPSLKIDGYFYNQEKNNQTIKEWAQKLG
jgi:flavodoxin I